MSSYLSYMALSSDMLIKRSTNFMSTKRKKKEMKTIEICVFLKLYGIMHYTNTKADS